MRVNSNFNDKFIVKVEVQSSPLQYSFTGAIGESLTGLGMNLYTVDLMD